MKVIELIDKLKEFPVDLDICVPNAMGFGWEIILKQGIFETKHAGKKDILIIRSRTFKNRVTVNETP